MQNNFKVLGGGQMWNAHYQNSVIGSVPSYPSDFVAEFFMRNFKGSKRVCDIGCGGGRHTAMLASMGFDTYALDYAPSSIEYVQNLLNTNGLKANLCVGCASDLPYQNEFFDGVLCYGVIMYGDGDFVERCADEIYRVLKPDAKAYLQFRNLGDFRYINGEKIGRYQAKTTKSIMESEEGQMIYYFDEAEIKRVFAKFSKIDIDILTRSYENESYKISYHLVTLTK